MVAIKTEMGQQVLKDRSVPLSPKQRSAFILFDGKRSVDEVLAATAAMGVTSQDIDHLFDTGLLADMAASTASLPRTEVDEVATTQVSGDRAKLRYQRAYPVATRLTAALGLRGFRLNLAIEAASSYEELKELAPRIREAVGGEQYRELELALRS